MFQLENQYRLFDYSINLNDVIQLMVRTEVRTVVSEENSPKKSLSEIIECFKNDILTPSSSSSIVSSIVNILCSIELRLWINYVSIFRMIPMR